MVTHPWTIRTAWLVVAAIGLAACGAQATGTTQTTQSPPGTVPASSSTTATSTTSAATRSDFPTSGPVEPGTYHLPSSAWSVAGLTLTMPEGWETQDGSAGAFKVTDDDREVGFSFVIVDAIYADPCVGSAGKSGGEPMEVGPSVDDLTNALLDQPHTVTDGPVDTTLGGLPAQRIELTMATDAETATCNVDLPGNLQIWFSAPAKSYFVLPADGTASVYILEINGERQVLVAQHPVEAAADDVSEMHSIIESVVFDT